MVQSHASSALSKGLVCGPPVLACVRGKLMVAEARALEGIKWHPG
jgi:hypothetical protein